MSVEKGTRNGKPGGGLGQTFIARRLRFLLFVAALAPFVLALAVQWAGSTPAAVSAAEDRPALAFHQYLVDLGKVPASPVVGARFRFTNRGRHTVTIQELKPSCGCLQPRLAKMRFEPGESGEVILPVRTPNQAAGKREYSVRILYTDPQPRERVLTFRVELPEKQVTVRPRALIFYLLGGGETKHKLFVTDYPKIGFRLTSANCTLKFVSVKIDAADTDAYGHPRHPLSITVADDVPPGIHRGVVTIQTDHPRYRVIQVPLLIEKKPSR